jgi:hypothetical protein
MKAILVLLLSGSFAGSVENDKLRQQMNTSKEDIY